MNFYILDKEEELQTTISNDSENTVSSAILKEKLNDMGTLEMEVESVAPEVSPYAGKTLIINGDFSNGVYKWGGVGSTVSVSNNALTITGSGSTASVRARQDTGLPIIAGNKIYARALMKAVNTDVTTISVRYGGTISVDYLTIATPCTLR